MRSRRSVVVLVEGREKAIVRLSEMPGKVSTRMFVVAMVDGTWDETNQWEE